MDFTNGMKKAFLASVGAAGEKRNGTGGYDFIRNRYGGIDHWNDRVVFCLFKSEWSLCRYDDEWCEMILRQIS